jgi:long-subunit acyl-CoA synthetase (AMP-forming)
MYHGVTLVPIYDTLGKDGIKFIVNQTKMKTIFLTLENLPKLVKIMLETMKDSENMMNSLKNIVLFENEVS